MNDVQQLTVLGVSHRSAPLAVRETLSFNADQAASLLRELACDEPQMEVAVLSTCNRTEFYMASQAAARAKAVLYDALRKFRPQASILHSDCRRYEFIGASAIRHVLRVACGLDSAVLGDVQILSQLKKCSSLAADSGTLGRQLRKAFDLALALGKQARSETNISVGNASIGSAIVGILTSHFDGATRDSVPRIIILGAGEVAASVARQLNKHRLGRTCCINRNEVKARHLARLYGGETRAWSDMLAELSLADAVVAATSAEQPVLTRDMLAEIVRQRGDNLPLVIDAGMPRNVEAGSPFPVLNVDQIREQHAGVLRMRQSAIPAVEQLIERHLDSWLIWQATRPIDAIVKSLYIDLDDCQRNTQRQLAGRQGPHVHPDEFNRMIFQPMRRVLHQHVTRLRNMYSPSHTRQEASNARIDR